jgi:predicted kinase
MTSNLRLPQTLIILSGLPGCGKTTLARLLVQELQLPILTVDDMIDAIPAHMTGHSERFWEDMVHILLHLVDAQLAWGHSVIVDSVFMGVDENQAQHSWSDRQRAYEIAQRRRVIFRPIYLYISDEAVWRARLAVSRCARCHLDASRHTTALFPALAAGSGAFSGWFEQR